MISLLLWRERLDRLGLQLRSEPDAALDWRWRCEAKVLRFLLRRYGEQPRFVPLPPSETTWISWLALDAADKRRVLPRDLTHRLRHIASANRQARLQPQASEPFLVRNLRATAEFWSGLWLDIERREIERTAIQRERERGLAERKRQKRFGKNL